MSETIGANDPCPCGSGKKYKRCCALDTHKSVRDRRMVWLRNGGIALAVIGLIVILTYNSNPKNQGTSRSISAPPASSGNSGTPARKPGQVWSEEHGHWHDAPATTPAQNLKPQPADVVPPEGVTWSGEHDHWHDGAGVAFPISQPAGAVPAGKTWSADHGHWHDAP